MSIDQNRDTGRFRGLLCRRCNTILGMLGDALEPVKRFMERVVPYLS